MNDIIKGEKPSQEEIFYKRWGWETLKESISVVDSALKISISLNIAILSVYVGFFEKIFINSWIKIVLFILLIISLISSILGIFPFSAKINLNKPQDIKCYKEKRFECKKICVSVAFIALITGFVIFLISKCAIYLK